MEYIDISTGNIEKVGYNGNVMEIIYTDGHLQSFIGTSNEMYARILNSIVKAEEAAVVLPR